MKSLLFYVAILATIPWTWAKPLDVTLREAHQIRSLEKGVAAFAQRLKLIEEAKESIDVEYFIYDTSDASRIFTEALVRKKKEQPEVRVRLMLDYFALSKSLDPYYTTALMKQGIEVRYYNPAFLLNLNKVTSRNHRKILLVDRKVAIIGGRNMADEYYDIKKRYNFMDRDVWISGPITQTIAESFDAFWESPLSKIPKAPARPSVAGPGKNHGHDQARLMQHERMVKRGKAFASLFDEDKEKHLIELKAQMRKMGDSMIEENPIFEVGMVRFVADGENLKDRTHSITGPAYYELLANAEAEAVIETPYFYLQKNEKLVFEDLKERDVSVKLLLNSKKASNEFAINYITLLQGLEFSKMGFDLFLNRGEFMREDELPRELEFEKAIWMVHAKTMVVDEKISWIGTLNMDPRSIQRLNAEYGLVVYDQHFSDFIKKKVLERMERSYTVKNGKVKKDDGEHDPAQIDNLWEQVKTLSTVPFYMFENQI